jgi:hypothetical protein
MHLCAIGYPMTSFALTLAILSDGNQTVQSERGAANMSRHRAHLKTTATGSK